MHAQEETTPLFCVSSDMVFGGSCGEAERALVRESKQLPSSSGSGTGGWEPLGGWLTLSSCFLCCKRMEGYFSSLPDLTF